MSVIRTILNNGDKTTILHVYLVSEGTDGDLVNFVIADPETYDDVFTSRILQPDMKLTITQIWYNFSWFDAFLSFDDITPVPCWSLPRDGENYIDFRYFGGLAHRLPAPQTPQGTNRTGKILLSTSGFAPVGSVGTMILEIKKNRS